MPGRKEGDMDGHSHGVRGARWLWLGPEFWQQRWRNGLGLWRQTRQYLLVASEEEGGRGVVKEHGSRDLDLSPGKPEVSAEWSGRRSRTREAPAG